MGNNIHAEGVDRLPAGTDILAARQREMLAHPHQRLSRTPAVSVQTFRALLNRTLALQVSLAKLEQFDLDERPPLRDALRSIGPMQGLSFSDQVWAAMATLVTCFLAVESRLEGLDETGYGTDLLNTMSRQVALNGYLSRNEEDFYSALEILVYRVPTAEARLAALATKAAEAE